ncbi:MAG TPA: G5 domain-containing protein [Candidatus Saccharimonadales bacterium]|nr:G5 domain-containing protein [Candidatus Saccharimonadales bacterium]
MTERLKSLPRTQKAFLGIGALVVLLGIIGVNSSPPEANEQAASSSKNSAQVKGDATKKDSDNKQGAPTEYRFVDQTIAMPYSSTTKIDASLPKGQRSTTPGVIGEKVITFKVAYVDGKETGRTIDHEKVTKKPVNEVTLVGSKAAEEASCNTNYAGCVPNASDVDCAASDEDGPVYVGGPIKITGTDVYKLDHDNDGVACE